MALFSSFIPIQSEETVSFHVDPKDNFQSVVEAISCYLDGEDIEQDFRENTASEKKVILVAIGMTEKGMTVTPVQRAVKSFRNYEAEVTPKEKKKIRKIVTTLGFDSLVSIAKPSTQSDLKSTGKDIDHIHPLRFLQVVFTDEEMKAGIAAIRNRAIGWIWDEFLGGLVTSLKEESGKKNLKPEFIRDFARNIPVHEDLIQTPLNEGRFKDFVNLLIDHVPRQNDPNRYAM